MKKTTKRLVLAVLLFLLLLLTGYFILAFYYREGFSVNTWINGVYCTGKTVEEVNSELLLRTEAPIVGTGIEKQLVEDSRTQIAAEGDGVVEYVDATTIRILYDLSLIHI